MCLFSELFVFLSIVWESTKTSTYQHKKIVQPGNLFVFIFQSIPMSILFRETDGSLFHL